MRGMVISFYQTVNLNTAILLESSFSSIFVSIVGTMQYFESHVFTNGFSWKESLVR